MGRLIAQISDSHVGFGAGDGQAARALAAAVDALLALDPPPVAVLFTGDLTNLGGPKEYERVRELLEPLPMPVHPLVGNHDDRDALRAAFADHPGVAGSEEFVQYTVQCGPVRVIACDTHVPGEDAGRLDGRRIEWLEAALASGGDQPTIVAMHHPPIGTGMPEFDVELALPELDRAALREVTGRIDLIATGHIHLPVRGMLGARPVFVCPSVYLQAELDLRPGAGITLVSDPPGYGLHLHGADPALISYVRPIARDGDRDVE